MQFQSEKHWRCVFCFKHWSVLCHHFCGPEKRTLWSCDSPGYMMLYDFMGGHRWLVVHCCWQELYERHVGQLSQQIRNSQDWKMERKRLWNGIPLGCGKWRFIRVMVCDGGVWHPGEGGASQSILTLFPFFFLFVSFHQMILELRAALVEIQNRSAPKNHSLWTGGQWVTVSNENGLSVLPLFLWQTIMGIHMEIWKMRNTW